MSIAFLRSLNGQNCGPFRRWLQNLDRVPRIAWYPSAGEDWRDFLYLHPAYQSLSPAQGDESAAPDIFLHTDYFPWGYPHFLDSDCAYSDLHTSIHISVLEELPRLDWPLHRGIVHFDKGGRATGRVFFMKISVSSHKLGNFTVPLIYAFTENAAFCAHQMLPYQATISHVVHVRSGGGLCGGGFSNGVWMLQVLQRLSTETFITDGHLQYRDGDKRVLEVYPVLAGMALSFDEPPIRVVPGQFWSRHGDISWHACKYI